MAEQPSFKTYKLLGPDLKPKLAVKKINALLDRSLNFYSRLSIRKKQQNKKSVIFMIPSALLC